MNSTNVLKVIKTLKRVTWRPFKKLDMSDSAVHPCGTTHCHGGWYAIGALGFFQAMDSSVNYGTGALLMAKDLGFKSACALCTWAKENPDIWGNLNGSLMFAGKEAFFHKDKRPGGALSVGDIINHWEDVYQRLVVKETAESMERLKKALEELEKSKPQYEDITGQIANIPTTQEVPDVERVMEEA